MTITKIQAGTVSHGTLRTGDLIGAFASELSRHTIYTDAPLLKDAAAWIDQEAAGCECQERGSELVCELMDALNDIAPEGMYFGALEGDGSDFGFWHVEEFECERPGGCGAARNMIVQAITTKFFGPGNVRGSRIKAKAWAGSITVDYDHALNVEDNHREAAEALIAKLDWAKLGGVWHQGGLPEDSGYCFVCVPD